MTGKEARLIREQYGFSLDELSTALGYTQRQAIHRIENMLKVPNTYRNSLKLLEQKCISIYVVLDYYIKNHEEIDHQDYQILYKKNRIVKITIRRRFVKELSKLMSAFPFKEFGYNKNTGFSCIQFEYKV